MRIVRLQAEGFLRLVAVDITPEGDLIEIRGKNGNGKSSVLNAIFAALGGLAAAPAMPVREGEEYAIIRLDLGDLKVTRYFGDDGATRLKVENAEGAVFSTGQTMLDGLIGKISFDPLEFARMKPTDQATELRRLVPLDVDLDALAKADKEDYAARRDVNRDAATLKARIEAFGDIKVPDVVPDKGALVARLAEAAEHNAAIEARRVAEGNEARALEKMGEDARAKAARATELRAEAQALEDEAVALLDKADEAEAAIDNRPPAPDPIDVAAVTAEIQAADVVLGYVAKARERDALKVDHAGHEAKSAALTKAMQDREKARAEAISKAKMPVENLALAATDDGLIVTFGGIPFSQASGAEQLRVSTAIAMAANPKLRVLRIKDGSLLDVDSLAMLRQMATDNDFQIWGEFVGDEGAGIIMEAGEVRGAPEPERVEAPKRRKPKADEGGATESENAGDPSTKKPEPTTDSAADATKPASGATGGGGTLFERMSNLSRQGGDQPAAATERRRPPSLADLTKERDSGE